MPSGRGRAGRLVTSQCISPLQAILVLGQILSQDCLCLDPLGLAFGVLWEEGTVTAFPLQQGFATVPVLLTK